MLIAWLIEKIEELISNGILYLVLLGVILVIVLTVTREIVRLAERQEGRRAANQPPVLLRSEVILKNSRNVAGTVSALREIRSAVYGETAFRYYEAAVTYESDTGMQTALMGIKTEGQPLIWKAGDKIRLHVFRDPLMPSTADERIAAATAYGELPARDLHFRELCGCTLDETATVIAESDFETIAEYIRKLDEPQLSEPAERLRQTLAHDIDRPAAFHLLKKLFRILK